MADDSSLAARISPDKDESESKDTDRRRGSLAVNNVSLTFQDISFGVKDKRILHGVSGGVTSGELLAIEGASGSGKSTLLDVLGDRRIKGGRITGGTILVNGQEVQNAVRRKLVGFVAQDDALMGGFTVRETLWFAARLWHGYGIARAEIKDMVNSMLDIMGLTSCANVRVGNNIIRGVSGGQRRRVSIAVALLAKHPIMLLDEPTSGLDSVAAFVVVEELKKIASTLGTSIITTIHQPSSAIYEMFDSLLLLTKGKVVYFGPAKNAISFFELEFRLRCPDFFNPSDFLIDSISETFSIQGATRQMTPEEMATIYKLRHDEAMLFKHKVQEKAMSLRASASQLLPTEVPIGEHPSFLSTTGTLTHRGFLNLLKNPGLLLIRIVLYSLLSVGFGLGFSAGNGKRNDDAIQAINSTLFMTPSIILFLSAAVVPFFAQEKPTFHREYKTGAISIGSYVISSVICSIPTSIILAVTTSVILVFMIGLDNYGLFLLPWWILILLGEAFALFAAAISPHFMVGLVLVSGFWGIALVTMGFLSRFETMSWAVRWIGYITPLRYFFRASMRNQYETMGSLDSLPFPDGAAVLDFFGLNDAEYETYWFNTGILVAIQICFVAFFYMGCYLTLNVL